MHSKNDTDRLQDTSKESTLVRGSFNMSKAYQNQVGSAKNIATPYCLNQEVGAKNRTHLTFGNNSKAHSPSKFESKKSSTALLSQFR